VILGSSRLRVQPRCDNCPLWVRSGHVRCKTACPLYPQKRHQMRRTECPLWAKRDIQWRLLDHHGARQQRSQDPTRWIPSRVFIDFITGKDALLRSLPYHIVNRPDLRGGVGIFQLVRINRPRPIVGSHSLCRCFGSDLVHVVRSELWNVGPKNHE